MKTKYEEENVIHHSTATHSVFRKKKDGKMDGQKDGWTEGWIDISHPLPFLAASHHDNNCCFLFPDHSPEIICGFILGA